ncbi:MAG: PIG-L family deacetylase [Candidatus Omnitrophica bacterium]|nr:PIG-L family deacetylase [Candidatus Omnitrophota bacterium]
MNVLAIGAHFDDVEIGCGGAIAKHRKNGDRVIVQVVTHSKYNNHNGDLIREKDEALHEGKKAAEILDYELICNNYETKHVQFNHVLIEDINKVIDAYHIDLVYTHWDKDVHQDHQAIGRATLAAARKVPSLLMYQSNLYMNTNPFSANYFIDISEFIDVKMKAICSHASEIKKFGDEWTDFWFSEAKNNGKRFNVRYAEAFYLVKYLW